MKINNNFIFCSFSTNIFPIWLIQFKFANLRFNLLLETHHAIRFIGKSSNENYYLPKLTENLFFLFRKQRP